MVFQELWGTNVPDLGYITDSMAAKLPVDVSE